MAYVHTGRIHTSAVCPSCGVRIDVGEPRAADNWPARLHLSYEQMELLLIAAAEFLELCAEAGGGFEDAVSFVDWVRPDALSAAYSSPVRVQVPR